MSEHGGADGFGLGIELGLEREPRARCGEWAVHENGWRRGSGDDERKKLGRAQSETGAGSAAMER